jgi:hypothetical protein
MVTRQEFKELKEKYWNKEHVNKAIILTDSFPERMLIIVPYNTWSSHDIRHQIMEVSKSDINYYGCNGNRIKGTYTCDAWYQADTLIVKGRKGRDKLDFFLKKTRNYGRTDFKDLQLIFYPKFAEFIRDLKRNKIPIPGLSVYCSLYSFRSYFKSDEKPDNDIIKQVFGLNPKDLRDFRQNYTGDYVYNVQRKILQLKQLFDCSVKDICRYIPIYDYMDYGHISLENCSKQELKNLRAEFRYLGDMAESGEGSLRLYMDYKRCLGQLDETNRKKWPLYPKDFSKIQKLHDDAVNFLNRERDRIQAAKQAEKQQKYLENFYEKAKGLEMSDNTYSIIACKDLMDLVKEGRTLSHCVGSYVTSVSEGREYILFLRKKNAIDMPYFTIDVTPEGRVRQIHGYGNCNLTEEVKPFVKKWAKKFDLDISSCSGVYCHL